MKRMDLHMSQNCELSLRGELNPVCRGRKKNCTILNVFEKKEERKE